MSKMNAGIGAPSAPEPDEDYVDLATGTAYRFTGDTWVLTPDDHPDPEPDPDPEPEPDPEPGSGSVFETIISDMRDPHVSLPDGVPLSYDWSQRPRVGMGLNGAGLWGNVWGQIYSSGYSPRLLSTNTLVQVANLQLWVLMGTTWQKLMDCKPRGDRAVDAGYFRSDYVGNITKPEDPLRMTDGSRAGEPDPAYNMHFFPAGRARLPQGYTAIVSCFDARLIMQAPAGVDDRAASRYLASAGGDYYSTEGGLPPRGDFAEGRMRRVTNEWTTYTSYAGVVPPNNPPPIVLAHGGGVVDPPPVDPPVDPPPVDPAPPGEWHIPTGTVKILPVGDSITWKQGDDTTGWCTMPARFLAAGYTVVTVGNQTGRNGIRHGGTGAWCIDNTGGACKHSNGFQAAGFLDHMKGWLDEYQPHIVVINAGANDAFTGRAAGAAAAMDKLLGLIKTHRPQAMTLVTIPRSWSDIPNLHSPDLGYSLRGIEAVVNARKATQHVRMFNQYEGFGGQGSGHWGDYVHQNPAGTAIMMTNTFNAIMALR